MLSCWPTAFVTHTYKNFVTRFVNFIEISASILFHHPFHHSEICFLCLCLHWLVLCFWFLKSFVESPTVFARSIVLSWFFPSFFGSFTFLPKYISKALFQPEYSLFSWFKHFIYFSKHLTQFTPGFFCFIKS